MTDKIFTADAIQRYANNHRVFQAVVAIVGNSRVGVDISNRDFFPSAIYKAEGGVNVDGKEIVIKKNSDIRIYCYNDWDNKEKDTAEVVKTVVEEMISLSIKSGEDVEKALIAYAVKNTNVSEDILREEIYQFAANPYGGNPLSTLFR